MEAVSIMVIVELIVACLTAAVVNAQTLPSCEENSGLHGIYPSAPWTGYQPCNTANDATECRYDGCYDGSNIAVCAGSPLRCYRQDTDSRCDGVADNTKMTGTDADGNANPDNYYWCTGGKRNSACPCKGKYDNLKVQCYGSAGSDAQCDCMDCALNNKDEIHCGPGANSGLGDGKWHAHDGRCGPNGGGGVCATDYCGADGLCCSNNNAQDTGSACDDKLSLCAVDGQHCCVMGAPRTAQPTPLPSPQPTSAPTNDPTTASPTLQPTVDEAKKAKEEAGAVAIIIAGIGGLVALLAVAWWCGRAKKGGNAVASGPAAQNNQVVVVQQQQQQQQGQVASAMALQSSMMAQNMQAQMHMQQQQQSMNDQMRLERQKMELEKQNMAMQYEMEKLKKMQQQ